MLRVLQEDAIYPYLKENAVQRLENARHVARNTGMTDKSLIHLGGFNWCLFPWLGTRSFRTLRKFLKYHSKELGLSSLEFEGCHYMTFKLDTTDGEEWLMRLLDIVRREGMDPERLMESGEVPVFEKYDDCIPPDLLRKAYAIDRLRADEACARVQAWESGEVK
jgi:ATP-dependent Lhr-like helicase